jgi:hypothetical protein
MSSNYIDSIFSETPKIEGPVPGDWYKNLMSVDFKEFKADEQRRELIESLLNNDEPVPPLAERH